MLDLTPAKDWKDAHEVGFLVRIPTTGRVVRVRPMHLGTLLVLGFVPDGLVQAAMEVLKGNTLDFPEAETVEEIKNRFQFMDNVCRSCLVYPRVVDDPQGDDEITPAHLELGEKQFITSLLNLPASELARFRPEQDIDVESVDTQPRPETTT